MITGLKKYLKWETAILVAAALFVLGACSAKTEFVLSGNDKTISIYNLFPSFSLKLSPEQSESFIALVNDSEFEKTGYGDVDDSNYSEMNCVFLHSDSILYSIMQKSSDDSMFWIKTHKAELAREDAAPASYVFESRELAEFIAGLKENAVVPEGYAGEIINVGKDNADILLESQDGQKIDLQGEWIFKTISSEGSDEPGSRSMDYGALSSCWGNAIIFNPDGTGIMIYAYASGNPTYEAINWSYLSEGGKKSGLVYGSSGFGFTLKFIGMERGNPLFEMADAFGGDDKYDDGFIRTAELERRENKTVFPGKQADPPVSGEKSAAINDYVPFIGGKQTIGYMVENFGWEYLGKSGEYHSVIYTDATMAVNKRSERYTIRLKAGSADLDRPIDYGNDSVKIRYAINNAFHSEIENPDCEQFIDFMINGIFLTRDFDGGNLVYYQMDEYILSSLKVLVPPHPYGKHIIKDILSKYPWVKDGDKYMIMLCGLGNEFLFTLDINGGSIDEPLDYDKHSLTVERVFDSVSFSNPSRDEIEDYFMAPYMSQFDGTLKKESGALGEVTCVDLNMADEVIVVYYGKSYVINETDKTGLIARAAENLKLVPEAAGAQHKLEYRVIFRGRGYNLLEMTMYGDDCIYLYSMAFNDASGALPELKELIESEIPYEKVKELGNNAGQIKEIITELSENKTTRSEVWWSQFPLKRYKVEHWQDEDFLEHWGSQKKDLSQGDIDYIINTLSETDFEILDKQPVANTDFYIGLDFENGSMISLTADNKEIHMNIRHYGKWLHTRLLDTDLFEYLLGFAGEGGFDMEWISDTESVTICYVKKADRKDYPENGRITEIEITDADTVMAITDALMGHASQTMTYPSRESSDIIFHGPDGDHYGKIKFPITTDENGIAEPTIIMNGYYWYSCEELYKILIEIENSQ